MPETSYTVRAKDHPAALSAAMRQAEAEGMFPLRATRNDRVGPWTEDDRGEQLFVVDLQVDAIPEGERRVLDGNR
jgi:hypothetical protein